MTKKWTIILLGPRSTSKRSHFCYPIQVKRRVGQRYPSHIRIMRMPHTTYGVTKSHLSEMLPDNGQDFFQRIWNFAEFHRQWGLHQLRPLRKAVPIGHHQTGKRQARLDIRQMRLLLRLPAPLPEIRHSVWRQDQETRAVLQPEGEIGEAAIGRNKIHFPLAKM